MSVKTRPMWWPILDLTLLAVILGLLPTILSRQQVDLEQGAMDTLRELGCLQLEYQDGNLDKLYGRLPDFQHAGLLPRDFLPLTAIPGYDLTRWEVRRPPYCTGACADGGFTIVATPDPGRGRLRTFAICDDQTVRVRPEGEIQDFGNPCNWEPLTR
ncbi:MAG TPA: hypothetical protein VEI97_06275 [bacterium]|nr:hypothetical protein [bacterium]